MSVAVTAAFVYYCAACVPSSFVWRAVFCAALVNGGQQPQQLQQSCVSTLRWLGPWLKFAVCCSAKVGHCQDWKLELTVCWPDPKAAHVTAHSFKHCTGRMSAGFNCRTGCLSVLGLSTAAARVLQLSLLHAVCWVVSLRVLLMLQGVPAIEVRAAILCFLCFDSSPGRWG